MQDTYHRPEDLYFLPIGGTAMASLAGLLHLAGHRVTGVDTALYPPMSELLAELGIPVRLGWDPQAIPTRIDRVVIGNAVGRDNPEVVEVLRRGAPFLSQAEAVAHYVLATGRTALVVAGTHGKTTTTSLLAWILEHGGCDPSYLVGGMLSWNRRSFRLGAGPHMVLEGDEYNTAFFDRGPKFLHYRPHVFVLGPVEHDHADIYPDLDAVLTAFRAGTAQVPKHGAVVVSGWSEHALAASRSAAARVVRVGADPAFELVVAGSTASPAGVEADVTWQGESARLAVPMAGRHNLQNAAMALGGALAAGVPLATAVAALAVFPGVRRRLEVLGEGGDVLVVDDFAHHPTAVAVTVAAARERWPRRRLVVAFEPRSITAGRRELQARYAEALAGADVALIAPVFYRDRLSREGALDLAALADTLRARGVETVVPGDGDDPLADLLPRLQPGDVVVICSSGDFGGLQRRLLAALRAEA